MTTPSRKRSRWLAPALSAGFGAGVSAAGFGQFAGAASALGGAIGQKFFDITGYGDYTVNKNSLLSGTVPSVGNSSSHSDGLTISHREYLGDVITSKTAGDFAIASYTLNPNEPQTWEWLAQIACNYEEWVPEGILFYFKSTSGDALDSVNTALGTVIMATNYNPYNADFTSKAEMESYEFCTNGPPSCDLIHMVECDPHAGAISTYFMSSLNSSANAGIMDARFSQLGKFFIATTGFQGTSVNIGELWVTYQVTLLKPKLYESLGLANDFIQMNMTSHNVSVGVLPTGVTSVRSDSTIPFSELTPSNDLYFVNSNSLTEIHFPVYAYPTKYLITIAAVFSSSDDPPLWVAVTHAGDYPGKAPVVGFSFYAPTATADSITSTVFEFEVTVPGGFIKMPAGGVSPYIDLTWSNAGAAGVPTTFNSSHFFMTQIPYVAVLNYNEKM